MEFVEEKSPGGYLIKIFFKSWQFLAFTSKGQTIYADQEKKSMLHRVPLIVLVGENFILNRNYIREFELLKIRNGVMILPYRDARKKDICYVFIINDLPIDMIPVRIDSAKNIADMVKKTDASVKPDFVIIDETVTSNDVIVIKNRYRAENIIYVEEMPHYQLAEIAASEEESEINLNMLSQNPVFLARIHLKSMNLSKINQIILDFDLSALDTEYIMNFIGKMLSSDPEAVTPKNRKILEELFNSFLFYHYLLKRDDKKIRETIEIKSNLKNLTTFRTLIQKAKSIFPGNEEQLLFTEYDNLLLEKSDALQKV
jgi:hypothetical protein